MKNYRVYLCGEDNGTRVIPHIECDQADMHTPEPPGYTQWHEWADAMSETHRQTRCQGTCGLLCVWVPK